MIRSMLSAALLATIVACAKKPADQGGDDTLVAKGASPNSAIAAPVPPPVAQTGGWEVVVLYNAPKDTAAFEKYYREKHGPLVSSKQAEIGFSRAVYTKFPSNLDGSKSAHYRMAQLWFDNEAAFKKGTATPGFKAVAGDIPNFATGGFIALAGYQTN